MTVVVGWPAAGLFVPSLPAGRLLDAARAAGWHTAFVPAAQAATKAALLDTLAAELHFPAWFGHNWDALADCLADPPAADRRDRRGRAIVIEGSEQLAAAERAVLVELLATAVLDAATTASPLAVALVTA